MGNDAVQEDAIQTRTKENLNNQSQTNNHIKTKVTVKRATTDFENIKTVNKSETPNKNIIGTSRAYKKLTDKDIIKLRKLLAKHDLYHPVVTKSVREMTEDSSLEALDYSDNYTFQTLIFQPEPLTTKEVLDSKTIPFQIHSYLTGANSGDVYKINLQLDPIIANHVKKITVNPTGRSSLVELVRLANKEGKATNIWQVNFIRASGGLFGGAEILSQYTAENGKIELDDTVRNILEKMEDHSDKLNYLIYVKDSQENKKIKTSETSGYFLTPSETLINSIVSSNSDAANSAFKGSSGAIQFDSDIGEFGGITVDQQILKNGTFNYGGPLIDSGLNKQWRYHYQIDSKLVPYIGSIELHSYDFYGVSGFDKTYYPKNKVADLAIDKDGRGSITSSNLNDLIVFHNALPETVGIRLVIKYNQSPNNTLTRNAEYDENGNLISNTTKVKEDFAFYGYLTDKNGGMIKNTFGSSTYYIQDLDIDGLTDNFEFHKSHTDPFNQDTDGDRKNDGDKVLRYGLLH
ncbi:cell surface protein [Staphylococcus saprophyticus]|nr:MULTISPECIES: cell surface protein [Staphylococcus]MBN6091503.1 cell surface protein [Staphylococcus saprophyticus]OEK42839.1 cell surface protein [Staphylococcus saprophyticus]OEK49776.1 cell surface protein [Staphylococcus saprophyticus]